ncbi:MAG TPA: hypothetical protein VFV50_17585 [Bdellovibrionales bacterium]|nr:hypothetical protein [Bdellovibrionales bacterium]
MFRFLPLLLAMSFTYAAAAPAPVKVCQWAGGNLGGTGERLWLTATTANLRIKTIDDSDAIESGSFTRNGQVAGKDHRTYFQYDVGQIDGPHFALVDSVLLKPGTRGLLKIRIRNESFYEARYSCRDNQ